MLLGGAPTGDIRVEVIFQRLCGGYALDRRLAALVAVRVWLADQRGMKAGLVEAKSRQFLTETLIVSWDKLECRLDVMLGVPTRQRFNMMRMTRTKPDDTAE